MHSITGEKATLAMAKKRNLAEEGRNRIGELM
jgi:hypothetical protein